MLTVSFDNGRNADIIPGKAIRIYGNEPGYREPRPFDITFKIGDEAIRGSYNFIYTGAIKSITAKTVTIVEYEGSYSERRRRFKIDQFISLNYRFNAEYIAKHNLETSYCI